MTGLYDAKDGKHAENQLDAEQAEEEA